MSQLQRYRYPDDTDTEVKRVKRLAARCGRLEGQHGRAYAESKAKRVKAQQALTGCLETLPSARLRRWASVLMIDGRWCGATGQGAYWAVSTRIVNETAAAILRQRIERGQDPAPFQVL